MFLNIYLNQEDCNFSNPFFAFVNLLQNIFFQIYLNLNLILSLNLN